jgi:hypothetical protein
MKLKVGDLFRHQPNKHSASYWLVTNVPRRAWSCRAVRMPGGHREPDPYIQVGGASFWSIGTSEKLVRISQRAYLRMIQAEVVASDADRQAANARVLARLQRRIAQR